MVTDEATWIGVVHCGRHSLAVPHPPENLAIVCKTFF